MLGSVLDAQSKYDERQRISSAIGYALMRGIEVTIAALFQSFTSNTPVGTLGADLDDTIIRTAAQRLWEQSVTERAQYVFSPAMVGSLLGNDKFTSKDYVSGQSGIESAQLPTRLYGFGSYWSNLLRSPASGQHEGALFHTEAIILIRQTMPTVREQFRMDNLADGIVGWDLYNASEATWVAETPGTQTTGDYGAILIRGG